LKNVFRSLLVLFICLASSTPSLANVVCTRNKDCPGDTGWQVGIAVGAGVMTNPLVEGDNIPLVVIPDVAYYGDSFYFDNAELGWRKNVTGHHQISVFLVPNREKAFFSFWHTSNLLGPIFTLDSPSQSDEMNINNPVIGTSRVSLDEVSSRKWALDSGIRWRWQWENHVISTNLYRDITGVYGGMHASIAFTSQWQFERWTLFTSPKLHWYSDKLTDYYYGIDELELVSNGLEYRGKGGLQIGFNAMALRQISPNWNVLFRVSAVKLHSGMTDSPLVEESSVFSGFIGMAYQF